MIGIDLVKSSRINRFIEKFGEKALNRFLCEEEIALVKNYKTASGFWAVKEACSKALGLGIGAECSFNDMNIGKTSKGAPKLSLSSKLIKQFNITDISVSITHDGEYAIAVVALETSSSTNKVKQL